MSLSRSGAECRRRPGAAIDARGIELAQGLARRENDAGRRPGRRGGVLPLPSGSLLFGRLRRGRPRVLRCRDPRDLAVRAQPRRGVGDQPLRRDGLVRGTGMGLLAAAPARGGNPGRRHPRRWWPAQHRALAALCQRPPAATAASRGPALPGRGGDRKRTLALGSGRRRRNPGRVQLAERARRCRPARRGGHLAGAAPARSARCAARGRSRAARRGFGFDSTDNPQGTGSFS